jgi:lipoate-protein ligase A
MKSIRLLDLGDVAPLRSQTVYHAIAYAMTEQSPDTIILVSPTQPYVCVGYHQDLEKEVDLAYCQAHGLPVVRREVGGGAFTPANCPATWRSASPCICSLW